MTEYLQAGVVHVDGSVILAVAGEIDIGSADVLRTAITDVMTLNVPLALDLSQVTFIDSSGLNVLIEASNALQERGQRRVSIRAASTQVQRILSITGLNHLLAGAEDSSRPHRSDDASVPD